MINNWNLDRGIQAQDDHSLTWKAVTTGNYGAIDMWLSEAHFGRLSFQTQPISGEVEIADIALAPVVFEAGGLDRAIRLQRLPETMTENRVKLRRTIKVRERGDTRVYIRVQQEDGHRMWTSPVYLFRE